MISILHARGRNINDRIILLKKYRRSTTTSPFTAKIWPKRRSSATKREFLEPIASIAWTAPT